MQTSRSRTARRGLATLAAMSAMALMFTACGSSGGGTQSGQSAPAATSVKTTNGTITIGTLAVPGTLNPAVSSSGSDYLYLYMLYDRLMQRNPTTAAIEPMLAESWKFIGPTKLELLVTLRKGVTFQDGTPLNAQAVVAYSKAYIAGGDAGNNLQYVTSVTAQGTYTVVYHLSQQNAQLPSGLATRAGMIGSPTAMQKEGKSFATNPVGTGPYKFVSEVAGATYRFTRYSGYWNNSKLPRVKNIVIKDFQSETALVDALKSGDVNVAGTILPQEVSTLKKDSSLHVAVGPGITFHIAYFNGSRAPLNSRQIRLAFNLALTRKAIMNAATDGLGQVWTEPQPKGTVGYVKSLTPVFTYDPSRAKKLVKEAGYSKGATITCYAYQGYDYTVAGPIIVSEEKAVGIKVNIIPGTAAQVAPFFTNKSGPQCFLAFGSGQGNPFYSYLGLWSKAYYNAGKTNFGVDKYYAELFTTYTLKKEQKIFYDINEVRKTDPGFAIFYTDPSVMVYQNNVAGWRISPLTLDNWQGLYYTKK